MSAYADPQSRLSLSPCHLSLATLQRHTHYGHTLWSARLGCHHVPDIGLQSSAEGI